MIDLGLHCLTCLYKFLGSLCYYVWYTFIFCVWYVFIYADISFVFRKSSTALSRSPSLPKTHSRKNSSTDMSTNSGTHDNQRSKESTPSISFSVADGVKLDLNAQSAVASEKSAESSQGARRSFDGSESPKCAETDPADLREKCFEKSLNTILDKCSETSLDLTLDARDTKSVEETVTPGKSGKLAERKKKSVPWYTVSF